MTSHATSDEVANTELNAQQQQQQWLQRVQIQFQAQQEQMLYRHNLEMQQLQRQQREQEQQLVQQLQQQLLQLLQLQQQEFGPEEAQRQLLHQLQQQHEIARGRLVQGHKNQQQQLQRKQQQFLLMKQQQWQQSATGDTPAVNTSVVGTQVTAQYTPTTSAWTPVPFPATTVAACAGGASASSSYADKLKEMKRKYWDDLVVVYCEFERMIEQRPADQRQERINTFFVNLKRIIALLLQDPTKATSSNMNDLDRVEAHIQKQVLPILERLKNRSPPAPEVPGGDATSPANLSAGLAERQQQQQQQHQELNDISSMMEQLGFRQ